MHACIPIFNRVYSNGSPRPLDISSKHQFFFTHSVFLEFIAYMQFKIENEFQLFNSMVDF